jgi:hypothetical protein
MTSTPYPSDVAPRELSGGPTDASASEVEAVLRAVASIAASSDPGLVFEAAAHAAVPSLCDVCTVELVSGQAELRIEYPADAEPTENSVVVPILAQPAAGARPYSGFLTLRFRGSRPNVQSRLAGELLVRRAVDIVERDRLLSKIANLERALVSNREIGVAIGILMDTHKCRQEQAFDMLRGVSQNSHRKLAAVAQDVMLTGVLEGLPRP